MKVLVTGGLGFIGSHLVDLLISENHEVVVLDSKISNVINTDDRCPIWTQSVEEVDLSPFYKESRNLSPFEIIFHLASVVGPAGVLGHGSIGSSIINNTAKLVDYCAINQSLFVDISTSEIYGHTGLLNEDSDKICSGEYQFRTEYGMAKLLAEIMIVNRAKIAGLRYQIIRPFNVAGPRQLPDGGFVLPRFIIAMLTNQPITIFGDGAQMRAFTDVRDICGAIAKIAFSKYENEIWNVGNPANEMSIKQLAKKIGKGRIIHINPNKLHGPLFAEAKDKIPYIKKINKLLNWKPEITLNKTLVDTINYWVKKINDGYYFDVCNGKDIAQLLQKERE